MSNNIVKIKSHKSPQGLYVSFLNSHPTKFKINGKESLKTFSREWYFIEGESDIVLFEGLVLERQINRRAILKNPSFESETIPAIITSDMVDNAWYDWTTESAYSSVSGLYELTWDIEPEHFEEYPIEHEKLIDINVIDAHSYNDMKVVIYRDGRYTSEGTFERKLSDLVSFSELERMLTPEFALPIRPCSISSKTTYDIIRKYVKDNIDPKVSAVTSDFDFCFSVKKKISIKPYEHKWEITKPNGKSYAKPRFNSRTITFKEVSLFDMGHSAHPYGKYEAINGFRGDSINDLVENVKLFLDELMFFINTPVTECDCCHGTGHLVNTNFDMQKR